MRRTLAGLCMVICLAGLVSAQTKDKEKDKKGVKDGHRVKATIVKVDGAKKLLIVKMNEKTTELAIDKEVKFIGPMGGVSSRRLKDPRLMPGVVVGLVMDGKTLKEVHIPKKSASKDKDKPSDKK